MQRIIKYIFKLAIDLQFLQKLFDVSLKDLFNS